RHPDLAELVGPGNLWCVGVSRILPRHRSADGARPAPPSGRAAANTSGGKVALLRCSAAWVPALTPLSGAGDGPATPRRIETMPVGTRWASRPGVTLIGDAAHLMPPVGEGANQAMLDAAELARELVANATDPHSAIQAYEQDMFARIHPIA